MDILGVDFSQFWYSITQVNRKMSMVKMSASIETKLFQIMISSSENDILARLEG